MKTQITIYLYWNKNSETRETQKTIASSWKETQEKQLSTSGPQARQLVIRGDINGVCYNVESIVDAKNKILVDYEVTNEYDKKALVKMTKNAIDIIGSNTFNFVLDKGY